MIFVLKVGEWDKERVVMVSTDVKLIAKLYTERTNKKDFNSAYDYPNVDIWIDNNWVDCFNEFEKNEKNIIKLLSEKTNKTK